MLPFLYPPGPGEQADADFIDASGFVARPLSLGLERVGREALAAWAESGAEYETGAEAVDGASLVEGDGGGLRRGR